MATTVAECLRASVDLQGISDTPRLDVELLLAHCLNKDRVFLFTWPEHELTPAQEQAFSAALTRRRQGEPIAHILGYREFWSLPLQVNATTLIPRPDTELLVEQALRLFTQHAQRVLDLGTGTGAVALALASEKPDWHIVAADKFHGAVRLAEANRERLQLDNVQVVQSDWFAGLPHVDFDLIVSNPPYLDPADHHLHEGDLRYEPHSALVSEDEGLADIRRIIQQAAERNQRPFHLLLEHGWQQAQEVRQLLETAGYGQVETVQDLAGRERVTGGCFVPR